VTNPRMSLNHFPVPMSLEQVMPADLDQTA